MYDVCCSVAIKFLMLFFYIFQKFIKDNDKFSKRYQVCSVVCVSDCCILSITPIYVGCRLVDTTLLTP